MQIAPDPAAARAHLDRCHAWLMRFTGTGPEAERMFEERVIAWCDADRELRAREREAQA